MVMYAKAKFGEPMEIEEYIQVRYGMALWMLQENAGLSYNEARAYLAYERGESTEDVAKALRITKQAVYNLSSSARAKIEEAGELDEVFKGYFPLVINVNPKKRNSGGLF
ncbi:MAG: hypothetical protein LBH88_02375 [Candidatus Methanoplasma sp.]|jgi:hypothetical protein|nr:hypothetical protein [Candidatus Methanoplasma sp.]